MVTTVQISSTTKEELLLIKAQLEMQTGVKRTLNDAIRWLIEKVKNRPIEDRINAAKACFGALKDLQITTNDLKKLRRQGTFSVTSF